MAETDWTRVIERILPTPGAEDVLRMRTGVVDEVNSNGTADVLVSGLVIPSLPVMGGARVVADETVMLLSWRGSLVVLGAVSAPGSTPVGSILEYAGTAAPAGFLLADGTSYLRTAYPALFAVIGTTYGAADGTHFNVPNRKGRVGVGRDAAQSEFNTLGETGGAKTVTLTAAQSGLPQHTHVQNAHSHLRGTIHTGATATNPGSRLASASASVFYANNGSGYTADSTGTEAATAVNQDAGPTNATTAHNNLQPYIALNYIIKT